MAVALIASERYMQNLHTVRPWYHHIVLASSHHTITSIDEVHEAPDGADMCVEVTSINEILATCGHHYALENHTITALDHRYKLSVSFLGMIK